MPTVKKYPCVVTIAASDSSGGAGIQADIKTISATGSYAASIITALTAQNTQGVQAIYEISADFILQQMDAVFNDLDVQAVKIGMLYNKETIDVVKIGIKKFKLKNVILDPVMISKSGCALLKPEIITYIKHLFPVVDLITPNLSEAESILHIKIANTDDMQVAASQMGKLFQTNILLKGGHLDIPRANDVLYYYKENKHAWFYADRIHTKNTHGTGCTLSSAIASFLAQDYCLLAAITSAKNYLSKAILSGSNLNIGKGHGPVQHFFNLGSIDRDVFNR